MKHVEDIIREIGGTKAGSILFGITTVAISSRWVTPNNLPQKRKSDLKILFPAIFSEDDRPQKPERPKTITRENYFKWRSYVLRRNKNRPHRIPDMSRADAVFNQPNNITQPTNTTAAADSNMSAAGEQK